MSYFISTPPKLKDIQFDLGCGKVSISYALDIVKNGNISAKNHNAIRLS